MTPQRLDLLRAQLQQEMEAPVRERFNKLEEVGALSRATERPSFTLMLGWPRSHISMFLFIITISFFLIADAKIAILIHMKLIVQPYFPDRLLSVGLPACPCLSVCLSICLEWLAVFCCLSHWSFGLHMSLKH